MTNFPGVNWSTFFPKNVGERQENYEAGQQRLAAIRDWYRSFDSPNQLSLPDNFRLPGFSEFGENLGGAAYGAAEMLNPYNSVVRGTQAYNKAAVGTEDRVGDDGQWYEADLTGKQRFDAGVEALTEVAGTAILPAAGGAAALKYAAGAKPGEEVVRVASDLLSSGLVLSKSAQDVSGAATRKVLDQFADEGRPVDTGRRNFVTAMAATPVAMATAKLGRFDGALSKITDKLGALSRARKSLANQLKLSDAFDIKYPDPFHNNPFVLPENIIDPISNKAGDTAWFKQRDDMVDQVDEVNAAATQASKDFTQSIMDDLSPKELAELDSKMLDEVYDGLRANNDNTRTVYGPQHRDLSQTGGSELDHAPIQIQVKPSDPEFAIQQQKAMIKVAKAQLKNPARSKRSQRIIKQAEDEIEWIKSTIPKPLTKAEEEAKRRMAEGIRAQAEKTEKARLDSERLAMQKVMDKHGLTPEDYGKLSIEDFFD